MNKETSEKYYTKSSLVQEALEQAERGKLFNRMLDNQRLRNESAAEIRNRINGA